MTAGFSFMRRDFRRFAASFFSDPGMAQRRGSIASGCEKKTRVQPISGLADRDFVRQ
jgi:hypothetical protein